jgi:hypothetical protein
MRNPNTGLHRVKNMFYLKVVSDVCEHIALVVKLFCDVILELGQVLL